MAIITDATGRQLAQAVGGIDTGGLAKDTTLQATNTALGNMNSTQQGIATAISNLGTLIGNSKANISGDNIGDKSTFRNNIGINATNTPFDNTGIEAGNNVQDALKAIWDKIVRCDNNAQFPRLLANEQERWLIGMTRLSIADGCFVIACKYSNVVSVTEIYKSPSFAYTTNSQGTIAFTYNSSAVGVRGGAIRIY